MNHPMLCWWYFISVAPYIYHLITWLGNISYLFVYSGVGLISLISLNSLIYLISFINLKQNFICIIMEIISLFCNYKNCWSYLLSIFLHIIKNTFKFKNQIKSNQIFPVTISKVIHIYFVSAILYSTTSKTCIGYKKTKPKIIQTMIVAPPLVT